jgi:endonuclease I
MGTACSSWAQNTRIDSFEAAKKLAPQIYADREEEFYCGCRYHGKDVDITSCGYEPKRAAKRATRLEWEHVVPAEAFSDRPSASGGRGIPRALTAKESLSRAATAPRKWRFRSATWRATCTT